MRFLSLGLVLAAVVSSGSALGAAESTQMLTLEQALGSVERVNVSVLVSRETAAQALETYNQQRAGVLPVLNASVQQRRQQQVSIGTVVTSSGRPSSRFDALLTSNWSLFDADLIAAIKGAKLGSQVAQANYQAVVQTVLADVAQGYFSHLRNQRRLAVLDANIARSRALLDLARRQLEAGVATQIDVTRADSQLASAEQARLQQLTTLVASELFLKRLLDLPVIDGLQIEDFPVKRVEPGLFVFADRKTAFEQRADYLAAQKALEQTQMAVRASKYQRLPSLNVTGNYGEASPKYDDSDKQEQWNVTFNISMPIFDLRLNADKRVALSRQRAQEARVHALELQITAELKLALQDSGSRNAQVTVADKALALAREELRLAQQRYAQGVADNRELIEAQNRIAVAEDNQVEAVHQYNLSRVELSRVRGDVRGLLAEKGP